MIVSCEIYARALPVARTPYRKKTRKQSCKKKAVKLKKLRKIDGGPLIGTDLVTNTSYSNDVFAFGTTGGSKICYLVVEYSTFRDYECNHYKLHCR